MLRSSRGALGAVVIVTLVAGWLLLRAAHINTDDAGASSPEALEIARPSEPNPSPGVAVRSSVDSVGSGAAETTILEVQPLVALRGELHFPDGEPAVEFALTLVRETPLAGGTTASTAEPAPECDTGANGEFAFHALRPGRYRPTLPRHAQLAIEPAWIDVGGRDGEHVALTLHAHALEVRVIAPGSGPVAGAVVGARVTRERERDPSVQVSFERRLRSDARGLVRFLFDRPCRIDLLARAGELEGSENGLLLLPKPRLVRTVLTLSPPAQTGALSIRVVNQLGVEVRSFRARIRDRGVNETTRSVGPRDIASSGGVLELRPGEYSVVLANGYSLNEPEFYLRGDDLRQDVTVTADSLASVELRVTEGGRFRLRCADPSSAGSDAEHVQVTLRAATEGAEKRLWFLSGDEHAMTRDSTLPLNELRLAADVLPAGHYVVTASSERHEAAATEFEIDVGRVVDLELALERRVD